MGIARSTLEWHLDHLVEQAVVRKRRDDDGHGGSGPALDELFQIRVTESTGPATDDSADPATLTLPSDTGPTRDAARTTRQMTMTMTMTRDEHGLATHLLNDRGFHAETQVDPQLGSTEVWEVENTTMHTHPLHIHLVRFKALGRGPDGTEAPAPNERVGKDTVRVNPGETARILVKFGDFPGQYPWHCHVLEHEDHQMMRPFEVVRGNANGGGGAGENGDGKGNGRNDGRGDA